MDTFTFHNGNGRGAVWRDDRRGVLWLCSASDQHDAGYEHARSLAGDGHLYPQLDDGYLDGYGSTVPWGACPDEDQLEALRFTGGATASLSVVAGPDHDPVAFDNGIGWIRLSVENDLWTMTIRRTLVYADEASTRDRWLSIEELERLFAELTGQHVDEADFWAPPYDAHHINIRFLGGPVAPEHWLAQRIDALLAGQAEQALRAP